MEIVDNLPDARKEISPRDADEHEEKDLGCQKGVQKGKLLHGDIRHAEPPVALGSLQETLTLTLHYGLKILFLNGLMETVSMGRTESFADFMGRP